MFSRKYFTALSLLLVLVAWPLQHASAITISPPVYDYTLNPGDTIRDVIKLYNELPEPLTFYPSLYNFTSTPGDETVGVPKLYSATDEGDGRGLAPWIHLDSTAPITINARERANIGFSITIPENASPGSYFGSVQFTTTSPTQQEGPNVGLIGSAGVLVLARVNGNVVETLGVSRFGGDANFYTHLPVAFGLRLENTGTVHLRPTGDVFITNVFGKQVASLPVNTDFKSVLPGSARRFDLSWAKANVDASASEFSKEWKNFAFGRYTATLALNYGANNSTMTATSTFWVIPWMVLLVLIGGVIVLLLLLSMFLRIYNRSVISSYEKRKNRS